MMHGRFMGFTTDHLTTNYSPTYYSPLTAPHLTTLLLTNVPPHYLPPTFQSWTKRESGTQRRSKETRVELVSLGCVK